jgi:S1-C subfamily serine protease
VCAVVTGTVIGLVGCGGSDEERSRHPPVASAVVAVLNSSGGRTYQSTGMIWKAAQGLVLTSATAVWDDDHVEVVTSDGTQYHAHLAARSPCRDLAVLVLHPRPTGLTQVRFARSKKVGSGAAVRTFGFAESGDGKVRAVRTAGTVSGTDLQVRFDSSLPAEPSIVEHQAPVPAGSAGGPLVNANDEVLGINTAMASFGKNSEVDHNLSYAIGSEFVQHKLGELRELRSRYFGGWKREHECHHQFEALVRKHRGTTMSHGGSEDSMDHMKHDSMKSDGSGDGSGSQTGKKLTTTPDGM